MESVVDMLQVGLKITNPCPDNKDACRIVLETLQEALHREPTDLEKKYAARIGPFCEAVDLLKEVVEQLQNTLECERHLTESCYAPGFTPRLPAFVLGVVKDLEDRVASIKEMTNDIDFFVDPHEKPFEDRKEARPNA